MSLDIGAIVGISVAAAAVAVIGGKLLLRKKPSSSTNFKALNQGEVEQKTGSTKDFLSNRISATEFRQKMSSVGRGKGSKKKTKKRKSSKKMIFV
jgi:hypothetical protein